jgi:RHH-type transcriptional regulator, rel operon repressor / antitoxin RelB
MTSSLNHPFDPNNSDAEAYNLWLRAQIDQRLADNKQAIPHDQVMTNMDVLLNKQKSETWQIAEVRAGLEEANRGEFATDQEMQSIFAKYANLK